MATAMMVAYPVTITYATPRREVSAGVVHIRHRKRAMLHGVFVPNYLSQLAIKAQAGDKAAFDELYLRVAPFLRRKHASQFFDKHDLMEIIDDAVERSVKTYDPSEKKQYVGWLKFVLAGKFTDFYRKNSVLGLTWLPRDEAGRRLPVYAEELADWDEVEVPSGDVPVELLDLWKSVSEAVCKDIKNAGYTQRRETGQLAALELIGLALIGIIVTDTELARRLGTSPKQAGRYLDYTRVLVIKHMAAQEDES